MMRQPLLLCESHSRILLYLLLWEADTMQYLCILVHTTHSFDGHWASMTTRVDKEHQEATHLQPFTWLTLKSLDSPDQGIALDLFCTAPGNTASVVLLLLA